MKKTAEEIHQFYTGKVAMLKSLGLSDDTAAMLIHSDGLNKEAADKLVKEALIGGLASMTAKVLPKIMGAGKSLARTGSNIAAKVPNASGQLNLFGKNVAPATTRMGRLGQSAQRFSGNTLSRMGKGIQQSAQHAQQHGVGNTLLQGGKNFLSGSLLGTGKGVGGTLGKGVMYSSLAGGLAGSGAPPEAFQGYNPYGA